MKIEVRYISRTGNTKRVAEAIAEAVEAVAVPAEGNPVEEADILFLGSAVYAAQLDKVTKQFIENLNPEKVKEVILFGTSAGGMKPFGSMRKCLKKVNVNVRDAFFYCTGHYLFMAKGHPSEDDLEAAKKFAREQIK